MTFDNRCNDFGKERTFASMALRNMLSLLFLISIFTYSCRPIPFEEYPTVSFQKVIALKKLNNNLEVILIDSHNRVIEEQDKINLEFYCSEFRLKSKDTLYRKIVEMHCPIDERMMQVMYLNIPDTTSYLSAVKNIEIDCHDLKPMIDSIYFRDQYVRNKSNDISKDYFRKINSENTELVQAILEECGIVEEYADELWLFIQHAPYEMQVRFYERLNELYNNGIISASRIGLLRDRILLRSGYHQEYGSQVNSHENYKIYDFENVEALRKEMGMVTLEEYYKLLWGPDWKSLNKY